MTSGLTGFALAGPHDPSFTPLGDLAGGAFSSTAAAISADGTTVVGTSASEGGNRGFVWTAATGIVDLGASTRSAVDVSGDGSIIVGQNASNRAYRRNASGQFIPMSYNSPETSVQTLSSDGTMAGGSATITRFVFPNTYTYVQGATWNASGTRRLISLKFSSRSGGVAPPITNVSADGSVLAAGSYLIQNDMARNLGLEIKGMSADGGTVVGFGTWNGIGSQALLWTEATGRVPLGELTSEYRYSYANAVSPDGRVVVGHRWPTDTLAPAEAFLWTADAGMLDLRNLLAGHGLAGDLAGWTLTSATDVTVNADGVAIVTGTGVDPLGRTQAFVAAVPEPGMVLALGLDGFALLRRRKSR